MSKQKDTKSLTGKNVVVLGNLYQHVQRFADANREKLGFRLCKTMGNDTDIVVAADDADAAEVKRAKKQGLRVLDSISWFDAVDEAVDECEKAAVVTSTKKKTPSGTKVQAKDKGPAKAASGVLKIYMPCIEEDWEFGRLVFDEEARADMPAALRKKIGDSIDGWQVSYGKATIGLVFDLSDAAVVSRLEEAMDAGWSSWVIRYDWSQSSVVPSDIEGPDGVEGSYVELRARVGQKMVENLESYGAVEFEPNGNEGSEPDRPDDSTLYDCSSRGEAPWKVTLTEGGKTTVLYDGAKKRLSEDKLRALILKTIQ